MRGTQSRRDFVAALSTVGVAGLVGTAGPAAAEEPPETTTIRLEKVPSVCVAPQYVAEELLRAEGFTDVRYLITETAREGQNIGNGEVDFAIHFAGPFIMTTDVGNPIKALAGLHPGCFELFGREDIRSIVDLRGKTVGIPYFGSGPHVFLASMGSYVGLDPAKDIRWITSESVKPRELFVEGKIDAFLGFPPDPQVLRSKNIGRVVVNSSTDRPWSQYFCCFLAGNAEFVRKHPIATKRVVRAILKAADLCASEPTRTARLMVDGGFSPSFDLALQILGDIPYGAWREYDPEDTIRFYALRLHEAGMIRSSPQKIIVEGTDWRFLDEVKRELKA